MSVRRIYILVALFVGLSILVSATYFGAGALAADQEDHNLAGSWEVTVIPDASTGVPPFVNFTANTKDGRVITTNGIGLTSIGEWERIGDGRFATFFTGFEPTDGQAIRYTVRSTVELSQDKETFSGPFATDIYDAGGNLLFTMTGTVEAERIHIVPLD